MYRSCLFCHHPLGTNQVLEQSPAGQRFAFDQARGRLWVICLHCRRWNLTPFEDRWEVIEQGERLFRDTHLRLSTANIGLARLGDGTDLIRIGKPLRPEFAAWRYGRQFLARRPAHVLHTLGVVGVLASPLALGALFGPMAPLALAGAAALATWRRARKPAFRVDLTQHEDIRLSATQVDRAELISDRTAEDGWAILVDHLEAESSLGRGLQDRFAGDVAVLTGRQARTVATFVLPRLNPGGGTVLEVAEAVRWLEAAGGPGRAFREFANSRNVRPTLDLNKATFATMHPAVRLALEMAIHEDEERRLMYGELSVLEVAWRREERLAAIIDRIAIPERLQRQLDLLRQALTERQGES
ncbi:MAG TPA: hypothetical protein VJU15_00165 [Gemmatimonadales bacterium]|nr:hypothetical protein [Gemmatimonadales bacterium]